jgi:hypothetical protein
LGTADATAGTFSWTIAANQVAGIDYRILVWQSGISDESNGDFAITRAIKVDFNKDGNEDLLWRYYGPGGYNRVWFLGNTAEAPLTLSSPATQPTEGQATEPRAKTRTARTTLRDPREMGGIAVKRETLEVKQGQDLMGPEAARGRRLAVIDDPRKAGLLKGETVDLTPPLRLSDPRQANALAGTGTTLASGPSIQASTFLGGADLLLVEDLNWQIAGTGDFNNDGNVDILWRNISSGMNVVWFLNGTEWSGSVELLSVGDLNWQVVGTGDFNNDTHVDILWRNSSDGSNVVWYMDGTTWIGSDVLLGVSDPDWQIVGTGDFNRDGNVDILWRYNGTGGYNVVWFMNGTSWTGSAELISVGDLAWQIMGTGDYDKDGNVDILWRYNGAGGWNVIWYMNGVAWAESAELLPVPDLTWRIVNR